MSKMTAEVATALRKPFPKESVGKLPKGGALLDYVGHAAVTDRLLTVDPEWSWEPLALDEHGLPALDRHGNLWIKLTICGVTRLGVGDGKSAKEAVGDAIRNAAMRFGVALDLWAKENLVEFAQAARAMQSGMGALRQAIEPAAEQPPAEPEEPKHYAAEDPSWNAPAAQEPAEPITQAQSRMLHAALKEAGMGERDAGLAYIADVLDREVASSKELSKAEASKVIDALVKSGEQA